MDCKKVYQLDKYCNNDPPPCVLYEYESEQTTEVYMSIPETSTFGPSGIGSDIGSKFLRALGIIGCVSTGLALTGYLIWKLYKKFFNGNPDQGTPALEYHPEVPTISAEDLV